MFQLSYIADHQRLHITVERNLDFCEYRLALLRFLKNTPEVRLQSALWDLTRLPIQAILEGDLGRMTRSMAGMGRTLDLALVVPARATTGLGHTYLGRLQDESENIRMFLSCSTAEKWLNQRMTLRQREASS